MHASGIIVKYICISLSAFQNTILFLLNVCSLFVCLFVCLFYFFSRTGPNAAPVNIQGHYTSSTSIVVQWGEVPLADQNGIIRSYTVTYKALPSGTPQTKVVNAPTRQATLTGLNEYTNYSITVFASTVKGDGNVSKPIIVITVEDSKSPLAILFVMLLLIEMLMKLSSS